MIDAMLLYASDYPNDFVSLDATREHAQLSADELKNSRKHRRQASDSKITKRASVLRDSCRRGVVGGHENRARSRKAITVW
jgi:hypothetical protein